jgi:hypothetical protein
MKSINLTNGQKNAAYLGLGALAVYFIYKFFKGTKKDEMEPEIATQTEGLKQPNQITSPPKANYDLKVAKGDKGLEVGILQKSLKGLDVDGDFGEGTEARLFEVTGTKSTTLNQFNQFLTQKKKSIDSIVASGNNSNANFLKTLEVQFLNSWNKAVEEGKTMFEYNGSLFNTQGGKKIYNAVNK